jgi:hypothetical protein
MSDYTPVNDYSAKDALASGNPLKLIKGTDVDQEFDAIAVAIATKFDSADIASQGAAEAGSDNTSLMTPLRTQQWAGANSGIIGDLQALADPNADRIAFWDDSAGVGAFLAATPATGGIGISGTELVLDIDALTNVTPAAGDEIVVADASDGGNPKAVLISALDHDGFTNFVANEHVDHSTVSITAGTGLSGGGNLTTTRTLNLDISGLTAITIADIASSDGILIDDGGTMKRAAIQSLGTRVEASATQILAIDDGNKLFVNTGGTEHTFTVPPNTDVAFPIGTEIGFLCQSTGKIALAQGSGVTITSLNSNKDVKASGGGAYLVKTATDTWHLVGDLEA